MEKRYASVDVLVTPSSLSDLKYFNKSWKDPYKMLY